MRRYDLAIFDVDGTIHDSFLSIAKSYQYALQAGFGIEVPDLDTFRPCVGPPIGDNFALFGVSAADTPRAIEIYQAYFKEHAQHECLNYPGMEELLRDLEAAGYLMAVASSKYIDILKYLLGRDGTLRHFGIISGVREPLEDASKTVLIERALAHYPDIDPSRAVMIGDRHYDAAGAAGAGIDFIAAGYGLGAPGEFDGYPMVYFAQTVADLRRYLLDEKME